MNCGIWEFSGNSSYALKLALKFSLDFVKNLMSLLQKKKKKNTRVSSERVRYIAFLMHQVSVQSKFHDWPLCFRYYEIFHSQWAKLKFFQNHEKCWWNQLRWLYEYTALVIKHLTTCFITRNMHCNYTMLLLLRVWRPNKYDEPGGKMKRLDREQPDMVEN